jgi:hypothetical protein
MLNPQKTLEREALLRRHMNYKRRSRSMSAICGRPRLGCEWKSSYALAKLLIEKGVITDAEFKENCFKSVRYISTF